MESSENSGGANPEDEVDFGFRRVNQTTHTSMVRDVFDSVAGRYDLMNDLMSGGLHRRWKAALLDRLAPRADQTLLDVAGGTGDIATGFLSRGGGTAISCDINEQMMLAGRDKAIDRGIVDGQCLACGDAADLPVASASVDSCTIVFGLRNVTRRTDALAEMRRALRPAGHFICMEFSPAVMPLLKPLAMMPVSTTSSAPAMDVCTNRSRILEPALRSPEKRRLQPPRGH